MDPKHPQDSKTIMTGLQSKLNKDPDEWFIQHIGCLPTDKVIELNKNTKERHDSI